MNKKKVGLAGALILLALAALAWYLHHTTIAVLDPKGPIAAKERNLIFFGLGLSLIVVVPVFIMAAVFAWKYRESNRSAKYRPDWDHNPLIETLWWAIPSLLILILSVVAWNGSHTLDPFRPIASTTPPIIVQAVALDWKWLFIYPQQGIASVNFVQFPRATPIDLEVTADAPMNSFWIPQLGGQIYAMPGMSTQLHLMATTNGSFYGSSANISGQGFADMHFTAKASSASEFKQWVNLARRSPLQLSQASYARLAAPSQHNPVTYYALASSNLYNTIIMKYMSPAGSMSAMGMQ